MKKKFMYSSPILAALSGSPFLRGSARIMDIFGNLNSPMRAYFQDPQADVKALKRDWEMVGLDMYNAIGIVKKSIKKPNGRKAKK